MADVLGNPQLLLQHNWRLNAYSTLTTCSAHPQTEAAVEAAVAKSEAEVSPSPTLTSSPYPQIDPRIDLREYERLQEQVVDLTRSVARKKRRIATLEETAKTDKVELKTLADQLASERKQQTDAKAKWAESLLNQKKATARRDVAWTEYKAGSEACIATHQAEVFNLKSQLLQARGLLSKSSAAALETKNRQLEADKSKLEKEKEQLEGSLHEMSLSSHSASVAQQAVNAQLTLEKHHLQLSLDQTRENLKSAFAREAIHVKDLAAASHALSHALVNSCPCQLH